MPKRYIIYFELCSMLYFVKSEHVESFILLLFCNFNIGYEELK